MSLWRKPIEAIEYADVDAFCQLKRREGLRLDYKADLPRDLAKTVAAMANTLGGMILLGVQEDGKTTEPIWPSPGMLDEANIEDRITNICNDGIYPPVRPLIRRVPNPQNSGQMFVVIRVDESPEAPHAVDQRRCVYERLPGQNRGYELAEVDRIAAMLKRRDQIEEQRRSRVQKSLDRANFYLRDVRKGYPIMWVNVVPTYPWRPLCTESMCFARQTKWVASSPRLTGDHQRVPGGAFLVAVSMVGRQLQPQFCTTIESHGLVQSVGISPWSIKNFEDQQEEAGITAQHMFHHQHVRDFAKQVFAIARAFYSDEGVDLPGFLLVTLGVLQAQGVKMIANQWGDTGKPFLDDEFRTEYSTSIDDFLRDPETACAPLFERLMFAFDAPASGWG
jgi:hypothetical protein